MKNLTLLSILLLSFSITAQNVYNYTYDDTGNRIQRDMTPIRLANPNAGGNPNDIANQLESEHVQIELDGEVEINLFPNPTTSEVNIHFNDNEHVTEEVRIIGNGGEIIYQKQNLTGNIIVPFSNLPSGNYFIWLKANGHVERFQVIKE